VDRDAERVPADASFQEVLDLVVRSPHSEFFVVDAKGALCGAISVAQLRRLLFEEEALRHLVVAADLIETDRPTVRESDDLDAERVPADASFQEVLDLVVRSPHSEFFVVDAKGALCGAISVAQLRRLLFEEEALRHLVVAADLIETDRPTVRESDDLDAALQLLSSAGGAEIAVVAEDDPTQLIGTLHERDVLEAYHRAMLERDLSGGLSARVDLAERGALELGGGYVLAELETPRAFAGRTLREIDLRARHGVQVLLLRSAEAVRVPSPDDRVQLGDVLVVAGPVESVKRLQGSEWKVA